ncbi:MAG: 50S ribosomal protein L18 [Bacteroidales bacterium]|jgi:large subunit ribosomal protein L18|nr:50S ribosomal protein L18 [Bacteroidales bacterium]
MAINKSERRKRIHYRIRKIVSGTAERPRMCVFRSNCNIYVQFVDDENGVTLASVSSQSKDIAGQTEGKNNSEIAAIVGTAAAECAKAKGISEVAFDRGGYLYHGRIKSLAEAARKGGLKF